MNKVASIKANPVKVTTVIGCDNIDIRGCNSRASSISGNAASAKTTPRIANRRTDHRCQQVCNQVIVLAAGHAVELLGGGNTSSNGCAVAMAADYRHGSVPKSEDQRNVIPVCL